MNIKLLISFLLINSTLIAQKITIKHVESRLITHEGVEFIGDLNDKGSDVYLYETWDNKAIIFVDNNKYQLSNINFNITSNSFESRLGRNKIFSFKNIYIDSVKINNHFFKKSKNYFYEVLFENKNNQLLKKHEIEYQEGILNRLDGKVGKSRRYIVYKYIINLNNSFSKIELNKKSILNLFKANQFELEKFVKRKKLSYKKEKDIVKIMNFILRK